ncbi:MAG: hypothetical protein KC656_35750, partial [Myxococcales bacterium]|nr:hypothetical protein [Myxococcales bacterium]
SDGCFGVLSWPGEHRALLRRVRRFLAPGGRFVFRVFVRPGPEAVEEVIERALDGRLATFHAFKLCLLMASQPDTAAGVVTGEVWERWSAAVPDPTAFAARTGWPVEQVATIDAYRGQPAVYTFPTLAEIRSVLDGEGFEVERVMEPGYPLGSRCPTLVARPR